MKEELLIRFFDKKKYAEDFIKGQIRMNYLAAFWGPDLEALAEEKKREGWETKEIKSAQFGQDDMHEGVVAVEYKDTNPIAQAIGTENVSGNVAYRIEEFGKCNLLCMYAVDIDHDSKKIYLPDDKKMKEKFGSYAVMIHNKQEFIDHMIAKLDKDDLYLYGRVHYTDMLGDDEIPNKHHISMQSREVTTMFHEHIEKALANGTAQSRDVFEKNKLLKYQKEYRFCFYLHDAMREVHWHNIDDISSFTELVEVDSLNVRLRQLYPGYSYSMVKPDATEIKGNISRDELVKKIYAVDRKVRVLFVV